MALWKQLFIENWQRKLISLLLAIVIWMIVNFSMSATKILSNIPVRVVNLPPEKTIEGMQTNGILNRKISLSLTGNKAVLDELTNKDLEVVLDAAGKPNEWIANITKKHLTCINHSIDLNKALTKIAPAEMIIKQSKLITDKIPILITQPIGEAPKGYQFLDLWPYQVSLTVTGPEEAVKRLKMKGLKLTFNLNDISKAELDALTATPKEGAADEISFFVPNSWKKVSVPLLSESPFEIDDPQAKALRIDFSRQDLIALGHPIPVTVYFPPKYSATLNPETYALATNDFIVKKNGIKMITAPLCVQGVSRRFLEIVKDRIQIVIIALPKSEREALLWNTQFMYPHDLEDRYVAKMMLEQGDESSDVLPHLREDFLRNRFRSYMNHFRLYTPNHKKLSLKIELQADTISVTPLNYP
ncbi:MAG: hypothetical protein HY069_01575 [Chlamydiia bacterium]|nr:hypothetical protein [Chlamydiia bacterium]